MKWRSVDTQTEFLNPEYNQQPTQQIQEEATVREPGLLERGGKFAKQLGIEAVKAPLKLAENIAIGAPNALAKVSQYLGQQQSQNFTPEEQEIANKIIPQEPVDVSKLFRNKEGNLPSEQLGEALGGEQGYKPENIVGRGLLNTAGNWPLLFFGPGSVASKVGADVAGSLGMETAKDLDLGPLAQVGAGVLSSKGFNKASNLLKGAAKNPSKIGKHISDLYSEQKKLGDQIFIDKPKLMDKLNNLEKKISGQLIDPAKFSSEAKRDILSNLETIRSELRNPGKLTGSELFDIKKNLNSIYSPKNSIQNNFYKDFRNIVKGSLEKDLSKLPKTTDAQKWIDTWKTADELYKIQNWQTDLGRNLDKLTSSGKLGKIVTNPIAQSGLAIMAGKSLGAVPAKVLGVTAGLSAGLKAGESVKRSADFINELRKTKEGQKLMWDIVVDSLKDNTNALASNLNKLNKKAEKFEPVNNWRVVDEELEFLD